MEELHSNGELIQDLSADMNLPQKSDGQQDQDRTQLESGGEHEIEGFVKYEAAIVLGSGWKEKSAESDKPKLSIEARFRLMALIHVLKENQNISTVIFSGGKTAGEENPSEAEAMLEYVLTRQPDLAKRNILIEGESFDTSENAENVSTLLQEKGIKNALLITSDTHLKRALQLFDVYGTAAEGISAEKKLQGLPHIDRMINDYLRSCKHSTEVFKEALLRGELIFDPDGSIVRKIAKRRREDL